jgi:hypothetical protein
MEAPSRPIRGAAGTTPRAAARWTLRGPPAKDLAGIVLPSILATACSTLAAVLVTKLIERRAAFALGSSCSRSCAPALVAALAPAAGLLGLPPSGAA